MTWTSETFREKQALLRLSNVKLAEALGVSVCYVEHMRSDRRVVSYTIKTNMTKLMENVGIDPNLSFL